MKEKTLKSLPIILIDSDGGVDDILCLALAGSIYPAENIVVSSVFGNVSVDQASKNLSLCLEYLGLQSKIVWRGEEISKDKKYVTAQDVHGNDGLGGITSRYTRKSSNIVPLSQFIEEKSKNLKNEKYKILSIGPATNIQKIIDTVGKDNIQDVTLMSGSIFDHGNITEYAEFNAYTDPYSLSKILSTDCSLNLVPLDICRKIIFLKENILTLSKFGKISEILIPAHEFYMDRYNEFEGINGCYPHDSIALLVSLFPDDFYSIKADLEVVLSGKEKGRTKIKKLHKNGKIRIFTGGNLKWIRTLFNSNNSLVDMFNINQSSLPTRRFS